MSNPHPLRAMAIAVTGLSLSFGAALEAQTIYIDFGANNRQTNDPGWNNMVMTANYTHEPAVGVPLSLADSNGNPTGISVTVTDGFAFENTAGVTAGSVAGVVAGYPETAYSDSWYINIGTDTGVAEDPQGQITFSNVPTGLTYNFGFFASRMGDGSTDRSTLYTANGLSAVLDAESNVEQRIWINGIIPNPDGTIVLDVQKNTDLPDGVTLGNFGYIGFLEIQVVPEPASLGLLGLGALGLMRRRRPLF